MRLRLLYSWAFLQRLGKQLMDQCLRDIDAGHEILIDSGAFTNFSSRMKGKDEPVKLDGYIEACKKHFHGRVWKYIALDVIREPEPTMRNLDAMLDAGLEPMPVLVMNASFGDVPKLMEAAKDGAICVAGGVGTRLSFIADRYQRAYAASDRKAKIHALGFSRWPAIFKLPIASADVSSFINGSKFGELRTYSRAYGPKWVGLSKTKLKGQTHVLGHLARCNVPLEQLNDRKALFGGSGGGAWATANSYFCFAEHLEMKGRKFFFVVASADWARVLNAIHQTRREDGTFDYPKALELRNSMRC